MKTIVVIFKKVYCYLFYWVYVRTGIFRVFRSGCPGDTFRVLMYHEVYAQDWSNFVRHIEFLSRYCNVLPPASVFDDEMIPVDTEHPNVVLSFDDGHISSRRVGDYLTATHRISALFFLLAERGFYNTADNELSVNDILHLKNIGHEIGSHGNTHRSFRTLDINDSIAELQESKERLKRVMGSTPIHFAFPYGTEEDFQAGDVTNASRFYQTIHTGIRGSNRRGSRLIFRDNVSPDYPDYMLGALIHGAFDPFYSGKRRRLIQRLREA